MNTTEQQLRMRGRIVAATALAAAAITTSALGQTAPANANADYFVAVAYSFRSDIAGMANNLTDGEQARLKALKNCQDSGGNHCVWFGTFRNECVALAVLGAQEWVTATGPDPQTAQQKALAANPGGRVVAWGCANWRKPTVPGPRFPDGPFPTLVPNG